MKHTTLDDVHKKCKQWLYIKSTNRIDLALAVHISRQLKGTKLWLIFVGGSGGSKSELLKPLDDGGKHTFVLQEITTNTLVSATPNAADLAPQLDEKTILIYDFAILLSLRRDDKAKIWAQFRELYDGNAGKHSGSGKPGSKYSGLNITMIGCSTSAIDNQVLIHNSLGIRELIYRIPQHEEEQEQDLLMERVFKNSNSEMLMRAEIKKVFSTFLNNLRPAKLDIKPDALQQIKNHCKYLSKLRSSASVDSYSGDVLSTAESEHPTRIFKQFLVVYRCLKSLDKDYSDEKALEIIKELRDSCCNTDRISILHFLVKNNIEEFSFGKIGQAVKLGNSTVKRHLSVLWSLNLVNRSIDEADKIEL